MKIGLKNNEHIVAAEWVDEEVQSNLKKRRKLNKIWRTVRRNEKSETIINQAEQEYREQKKYTSQLMGEKKGAWEKQKILEAKKNSKPMWNVIKEILGKTKSKEEQKYIYHEDGTRHKAQDAWKEFIEDWKRDIADK